MMIKQLSPLAAAGHIISSSPAVGLVGPRPLARKNKCSYAYVATVTGQLLVAVHMATCIVLVLVYYY
jgi:hypothetical protein